MGAYNNMDQAFKGMKADSRFDLVKSKRAYEDIGFGVPAFSYIGEEKSISNIKRDKAVLLFDADFVTGNTIDLKVNTVAITQVPFNTDHDTTAADLAAAITALTGVDCILDASDVNNRTFLIRTQWVDIAITDVVVAGGASQAGSTVTYSTDMVFVGLTIHEHTNPVTTNNSYYETNEAVNVLEDGAAWSEANKAVNALNSAYVIESGASEGLFTDDTAQLDVGCTFESTITAAGLVIVKVNGIKKPNAVVVWA